MTRTRTIAALSAAAVVVFGTVTATATTSHTSYWTNKAGNVTCGIKAHSAGQPALVLCSSSSIPRPANAKHGDPGFVQIGAHGKPQTIVTFQNEFPAGTPKTLSNGTTWSSLGVTCQVGPTVTCTNKSAHGFTIGYKSF